MLLLFFTFSFNLILLYLPYYYYTTKLLSFKTLFRHTIYINNNVQSTTKLQNISTYDKIVSLLSFSLTFECFYDPNFVLFLMALKLVFLSILILVLILI